MIICPKTVTQQQLQWPHGQALKLRDSRRGQPLTGKTALKVVPPTRRLFAVADRRRWEPHTRGNFWHGKTASKIELRVKQENFETEQRLEKERRALDEKQAAFEKERLVRLEEHHRLRAEVENVERLLDGRAGIRCDCCGFQGSSEADFLRHCRGKSHKRKGGSPPPVDGSTSTTSTSISSCASSASAPATGQRLKCVLCNVSVATSTELNEHLRGRRHRGTVARKAAKKEAAKVETDSNCISLTIDVEGLTSTTRRLLKNNVRSVSTAAATARRLGGTRGDRAAAADLAATARASASAVQVSFRLQERKRRAGARGEEKRRKRAKKRRQCHHEKQSNAGHTTDRRGIRGKKKDGTRKLGKQREPHGASALTTRTIATMAGTWRNARNEKDYKCADAIKGVLKIFNVDVDVRRGKEWREGGGRRGTIPTRTSTHTALNAVGTASNRRRQHSVQARFQQRRGNVTNEQKRSKNTGRKRRT